MAQSVRGSDASQVSVNESNVELTGDELLAETCCAHVECSTE
jgi:hypothetical protein